MGEGKETVRHGMLGSQTRLVCQGGNEVRGVTKEVKRVWFQILDCVLGTNGSVW